MYSNGTSLAVSGTATTAILAKKFRKPFYIMVRAYKFSNRT